MEFNALNLRVHNNPYQTYGNPLYGVRSRLIKSISLMNVIRNAYVELEAVSLEEFDYTLECLDKDIENLTQQLRNIEKKLFEI